MLSVTTIMKFGKQLQLGTYEPWSLYVCTFCVMKRIHLNFCYAFLKNLAKFCSQNKQYIQYSKLKRIINRRKFIADRDEAEAQAKGEFRAASTSPMNNAPAVILNPSNEYTLLQPIASGKTQNTYVEESNGNSGIELVEGGPVDDESDFFKIILSEIEKVNKFFVG